MEGSLYTILDEKQKRNLKILISVFAILIVAVVVVALLYVNNLLNLIGPEDPNNPNNGVEDQIYDEKDFAEIDGIKDANSLKDLVKNGRPMVVKNIRAVMSSMCF